MRTHGGRSADAQRTLHGRTEGRGAIHQCTPGLNAHRAQRSSHLGLTGQADLKGDGSHPGGGEDGRRDRYGFDASDAPATGTSREPHRPDWQQVAADRAAGRQGTALSGPTWANQAGRGAPELLESVLKRGKRRTLPLPPRLTCCCGLAGASWAVLAAWCGSTGESGAHAGGRLRPVMLSRVMGVLWAPSVVA